MISKNLESTLQRAMGLAKDYGHESTTLEHLLLALMEDPVIQGVFDDAQVDMDPLRGDIITHMEEFLAQANDEDSLRGRVSIEFQRVLQRATIHARSAGVEEINALHLLVSLFAEEESAAVDILMAHNLHRFDVIHYIANHVERSIDMSPQKSLPQETGSESGDSESLLEKYATHLNWQACPHDSVPLMGRQEEVQRLVEVLCRQTKNNPLLVGEPGVGKTALVEGIAHLIAHGDVPDPLKNHDIFSLDMGGLLAGTRFRGDFEERLKGILAECQARPNPTILFIDEVHTIIGTGAVQGGSLDTANLLKPALSRGHLRCIAATTFEEYRTQLQKDTALLRRFQKIDVVEPTAEECVSILEGIKGRFEKHHQVTYTPEAIQSAVDLSIRYLTDRHLPDKAIDVLDETGAHLRLEPKKKSQAPQVVDHHHIADTVGRLANVPSQQVDQDDRKALKNLERSLKKAVFGQNDAVEAVVDAVKLARSGLRHAEKPMGCFLFSGPTGVGKTEIARQLSQVLAMPLLRFDMSEYMEKHSVAKLIGAPPGYVGFEQGGLLTEAVTKNPYAILLLDEIEKAHPDIYNVLLQLMDYGTVTDPQGRSVNFRNTMVILTTNAGAGDLEKPAMGFAQEPQTGGDEAALKRIFTPEFRNRLDALVSFNVLPEKAIIKIVEKFLKEFEETLCEKNISLTVEENAKKWLAEQGYDPVFGARPLARLVEETLKKPLANEVLFGKLMKGGRVRAKLKSGTLDLLCEG